MLRGDGVEKDTKQGEMWLKTAAENGMQDAQAQLGMIYRDGGFSGPQIENLNSCIQDHGELAKDEAKAVHWLTKAAESGHHGAQWELARMYSEGNGVPQDNEKFLSWLTKASDQGYHQAQFQLGRIHEMGLAGTTPDAVKAFEFYGKAAAQGDPQAQFLVAQYRFGVSQFSPGKGELDPTENAEYDPEKGVEWALKAANQGHPDALRFMAMLYTSGFHGVAKDVKKAVLFLTKAAEQGDAEACWDLAMRYSAGATEGVERSEAKCKKWAYKAAEYGHEQAKNLIRQYPR